MLSWLIFFPASYHYHEQSAHSHTTSVSRLVITFSQGSCRVLTHLSKKTAKLNRSAVEQEKTKAVLPVIPVDEADRRRALYTGTFSLFCFPAENQQTQ